MDINQSNKIYDFIIESIQDIELELNLHSNEEKLDSAKEQVLKIINDFRVQKIDKYITELKQNQEWDTFTIAFYGETNAGKSTIIESLRIYFQEETKVEEQKKFQEILGDYTNKLKSLAKEIEVSNTKIDEYKNKHATALSDFELQSKDIETQIFNIIKLDTEKKEKSHWYRLISFLRLNTLKKDIANLESKLSNGRVALHSELDSINQNKKIEEEKVEILKFHLNQLQESSLQILLDLSDGQIIGNGMYDYTKQTIPYIFEHNKQKFAFLDIPGIEGKESAVIDEIESAVKRAHAVFYVTRNATPPQKGDEGKKGTLEKIKTHLGSQTEVYSIYNISVTNPILLENPLINEDKKLSLEILDAKMKEALSGNYIGHKILSAHVSFLALAECLLPALEIEEEEKDESLKKALKRRNEKNKFLNKFAKDDLLQKALFADFTNFLTNDLVQNTKVKIKKSNFNKANETLKELIALLASVSKNNFEPLHQQLFQEAGHATNNLENTLRSAKNQMVNHVNRIIRNFNNSTRKDIYDYIDKKLSDDEFKNRFELIINVQNEQVVNDLPIALDKELQKFQDAINEVMGNFNRRVKSTIQEFKTISFDTNDSNFHLNLNTGNGVDGFGLLGSLAGASVSTYFAIMAVNGWNPVGWTMAAWAAVIGVVAGLIGFGKSISKFFSDDYKKSEQRKSADKNIDSITKEVKKDILEKLDSSFPEFQKIIDEIVGNLESSVEQVKKANDYILDSNKKLIQLSKNIQLEGEKQ